MGAKFIKTVNKSQFFDGLKKNGCKFRKSLGVYPFSCKGKIYLGQKSLNGNNIEIFKIDNEDVKLFKAVKNIFGENCKVRIKNH